MREMVMETGYSREMAGLGEALRGLGRGLFLAGCPLLMASPWLGEGGDWFWFKLWYGQPLLHAILAGLFAWCGFKGLALDRRGFSLKFWSLLFVLGAALVIATARAWPAGLLNMNGSAQINWSPAAELAGSIFFNGQLYWILLPLWVWLAHLKARPLAREACALGGLGLLLLVTLKNGFPNFLQFACFLALDLARLSLEHILK